MGILYKKNYQMFQKSNKIPEKVDYNDKDGSYVIMDKENVDRIINGFKPRRTVVADKDYDGGKKYNQQKKASERRLPNVTVTAEARPTLQQKAFNNFAPYAGETLRIAGQTAFPVFTMASAAMSELLKDDKDQDFRRIFPREQRQLMAEKMNMPSMNEGIERENQAILSDAIGFGDIDPLTKTRHGKNIYQQIGNGLIDAIFNPRSVWKSTKQLPAELIQGTKYGKEFYTGFKQGYSRSKWWNNPERYMPKNRQSLIPSNLKTSKYTGPGPKSWQQSEVLPKTFTGKVQKTISDIINPVDKSVENIYRESRLERFKQAAKSKSIIGMKLNTESQKVLDKIKALEQAKTSRYDDTYQRYAQDRWFIKEYNDIPGSIKKDIIFGNPHESASSVAKNGIVEFLKYKRPLHDETGRGFGNVSYLQKAILRDFNNKKNILLKYKNSINERLASTDFESAYKTFDKKANTFIKDIYEPLRASTQFFMPGPKSGLKAFNKKGVANKNNLIAILTSPKLSLPKNEINLISSVIESKFKDVKNIPLKNLEKEVDKAIPKLNKSYTSQYNQYGIDRLNIDEKDIVDNTTLLLKNTDKYGYSLDQGHFGKDVLGHIRYFTSPDKTLTVLEKQNDPFQGNPPSKIALERESILADNNGEKEKAEELINTINSRAEREKFGKTLDKRMIYEVIRQAAREGMTSVRFPVPETVANIQGYSTLRVPKPYTETNEYLKKVDVLKKDLKVNAKKIQDIKDNIFVLEHKGGDASELKIQLRELNDISDDIENELQKNNVKGKEEIDKSKAEYSKLIKYYTEEQGQIINNEIDALKVKRDNIESTSGNVRNSPEYKEITDEIRDLNRNLRELKKIAKEKISKKYPWFVNKSQYDYSSRHKTILKKYSNDEKYLKKRFKKDIKPEVDTHGNKWLRLNIYNILKSGSLEALRRGGVLYKKKVN